MSIRRVGTLLFLAILVAGRVYSQVADDPMSIVRRAWELQQAGDYAAAVDTYRVFLKLRPGEAGAHSNLGASLVKLGRFDEAIEEYQEAEKLLPGNPQIGMNLALAYEKSGRISEAARRLEALHTGTPGDRQITMLLADCDLRTGDYDRVIGLLQPMERENPDDLATAYLLGTALIRERRIEEGAALLDRILRNGDSAEARFLLGTQYFESGDYPAAVKELATAIELNPRLPQLQSYYGRALLNTGDSAGAAAAFRKEIEGNPHEYAANLALGQILIVSKKYDEALPLVEASLLSRPESVEAGLALGQCLSGTGKLQDARQRLEAVTRADPSSVEAHRELLSVYSRLRLGPEAARERDTVSRLERESAAREGGPQINTLAPDFELAEVAGKGRIRLKDFRGRNPVVLVFGSYSCPNFRSAAGSLNAMFKQYGLQAPFFLVYIREAHASDNWQSTRNVREEISVAPALSPQDREEHAVMCMRALHLQFPALADGMDGSVERSYASWPSRAFVIGRDGRVLYSTRLTELDFFPEEMEKALRTAIGRH